MCRVSFLIKESFLPFILLSVLSTEFHIAGRGKAKAKALLSLSNPLGCNSECTAGWKR